MFIMTTPKSNIEHFLYQLTINQYLARIVLFIADLDVLQIDEILGLDFSIPHHINMWVFDHLFLKNAFTKALFHHLFVKLVVSIYDHIFLYIFDHKRRSAKQRFVIETDQIQEQVRKQYILFSNSLHLFETYIVHFSSW